MIDGFEVVFYTLLFIVPGFILYVTFSMMIPNKSEDFQLTAIRFLTFSCINYALWSWLIFLLNTSKSIINNEVIKAFLWFIIIFVSPIFIGLIIGYFRNKEVVRRFLQKLGLNPIHSIPTSWDYKFSKIKNTVWVIVTLEDGSIVPGKFSTSSFASSDNTERDIYIESVYKIMHDGEWVAHERNDGVIIKGDCIKYIEFFKDEIRSEDDGE